MNGSVDNKIVQMQFKNEQFEKNAKKTMTTLDELRTKLKLPSAIKGFQDVENASKNVKLSAISNALDNINSKFTSMGAVGFTVLNRLTLEAYEAGKSMLKSLTIAPISQGWNEYELKMGSVQTIMNSTGESLKTVTEYLEELNTYSDKTIYSFSDMTTNIGKFTNAGIDLKRAVAAIKGVSNLAAVSGSNANEASHAMYNLAQAISAGFVQLIDWKSIENANMATKEFKEQLAKTALSIGTLSKQSDECYNTGKEAYNLQALFRDGLKDQWLTTEVLIKTLNDYADVTTEIGKKSFQAATEVKTFKMMMDSLGEAVGSGWAATWENIFGDFNEGKSLWTSIYNVVGGIIDEDSKNRNDFLKSWKDLGGRSYILNAIANSLKTISSVLEPVRKSFRELFPKKTASQFAYISKIIYNISTHMKISDKTLNNIQDFFGGMFYGLKLILGVISPVIKTTAKLIAFLGPSLGKVLASTLGYIGRFATAIFDVISKITIFQKIGKSVYGIISVLASTIRNFLTLISWSLDSAKIFNAEKIANEINNVIGIISDVLILIRARSKEISETIGKVFNFVIKKIKTEVNKLIAPIKNMLGSLLQTFTPFCEYFIRMFSDMGRSISEGFSSKIKEIHEAARRELTETGIKMTETVVSPVKLAMAQVKIVDGGGFKQLIKTINEDVKPIEKVPEKIRQPIGTIAATMSDAWVKMKPVAQKLGGEFKELGRALVDGVKTMDFTKFMTLLNTGLTGVVLFNVKKILHIFRGFKKELTTQFEKITDSVVGILDGVKSCLSAFAASIRANALIKIAVAIAILTGSLTALSKLSFEQMSPALAVMGDLAAGLGALSFAMSKIKFETGMAANILALTATMSTMSKSIVMLAEVALKDGGGDALGQSLLIFAGALLSLGLATSVIGKNTKEVITGALGISKMAISLVFLMIPLKMIYDIIKDFKEGNGDVGALSGAITSVITLAIGMAIAMRIMSKTLRSRDVESDTYKRKYSEMMQTAKGFISMSVAMTILMVPVKALAKMDIGSWAKGVAGVLGLLGGITFIIKLFPEEEKAKSFSRSMLSMSGAFAIFAIGIELLLPALTALKFLKIGSEVSKNLILIAGGFLAFAFVAKKLDRYGGNLLKLSAAFGILVLSMYALTFVADDIVTAGPKLQEAISVIIWAVCKAIKDSVIYIVEACLILVSETVRQLRDYLPTIIEDFVVLACDSLIILGRVLKEKIFSNWPDAESFGIGLVIASALTLLFKKFISFKNNLKDGVKGAIAVSIAIVAIGTAFATALSVSGYLGGGENAIVFAAAMVAVTSAFTPLFGVLGKIKPDETKKGAKAALGIATAVGSIGMAFAGVMFLTQFTNMSFENVTMTVLGLGAMAWIFEPLFKQLGSITLKQTDKATKAAIGMAKAIAAIGAAFFAVVELMNLANVPIDTIIVTIISISTMAWEFYGLIMCLKKIRTNETKRAVTAALGIAKAIAAIGAVTAGIMWLIGLTNVSFGAMIGAIISISALSWSFTGLFKVLDQVVRPGTISKAVKACAGMALSIGMLGIVFVGIVKLTTLVGGFETLFTTMKSIAEICGAFGGLFAILNKFGGLDPALSIKTAISIASGIIVFAAVFAAGLSALGAIYEIPFVKDLIDNGTNFFKKLGEALGGFFGSIIKEIGESVISLIPSLGEALSTFALNFSIFAAVMENTSDKTWNAIKSLSSSILVMGAAEFVDSMSNILSLDFSGKPFHRFFEGLNQLGPALVEFEGSLSDVDISLVDKAANASAAIGSALSIADNTGLIYKLLLGHKDYDKVAEAFPKIGKAIVGFGESVADINPEYVEKGVAAGKLISGFIDNFTSLREGGFEQFIKGIPNYEKFINALVGVPDLLSSPSNVYGPTQGLKVELKRTAGLGKAITAFAEDVASIKSSDVEKGVAAGKLISGFIDNFTSLREGGFEQFIKGIPNYEKFINALWGERFTDKKAADPFKMAEIAKNFKPSLGKAIAAFAEDVRGIKTDDVKKGTNAGEMIAGFANGLVKTGGLVQKIIGETTTLSEFAVGVIDLAQAFKQINSEITTMDQEKVKSFSDVLVLFLSLLNVLGADLVGASTNFGEDFGEGLKALTWLGNLRDLGMSTFVNNFKRYTDEITAAIQTTTSNVSNAYSTAVNSFRTTLQNTIGDVGIYVNAPFSKLYSGCIKIGKDLMGNIIRGFNMGNDNVGFFSFLNKTNYSKSSNLLKALKDVLETAVNIDNKDSGLVEVLNKFMSFGASIIDKIVSGCVTNGYKITNALKEIINTTYSSCLNIGENFVGGFNVGTKNASELNKTKRIIDNLGNNTINSLRSILDIHSPSLRTEEIGEYYVDGFTMGIENNSNTAIKAVKNMANRSVAVFHETINGKVLGASAIVESPTNFIESALGFLKEKENSIKTTIDDVIKSISPSKLIGKNDDLDNYISNLTNQVNGVGDLTPEINFETNLDQINKDTENMIKDINNKVQGNLGGGLENYDISDITNSISGSDSITNKNAEQVKGTYSDFIEEVRSLKKSVDAFSETMANTVIVLDDNTLVGKLAPQLNDYFGARVTYAGRRN